MEGCEQKNGIISLMFEQDHSCQHVEIDCEGARETRQEIVAAWARVVASGNVEK